MSRKHFIVLGLFLAVGFLFLSASTVKAATYTWTGDGDGHTWTDGPNWGVGSGPNAYPGATSTDDVIIGLSTGNVVPTIYATTSLGFGLTSLTLGDAGKGPVLVIGNGATLNASTTVMVVGTSTLKLGDATWGSGTLRLGNGASGATPLSIGSSATFVTSTSTVTYTAAFNGGAPGSSIFIATTTYYNLNLTPTSTTGTFTFVNNGNATTTNMTISSAAQFNAATFVVSGTLTVNSGGVLDGVGGNITFSGSGTPFVNNGTFKADGGTVQYTSALATNIATGTYANLELTGAAIKTLLGATTATSTVTVGAGATLDGGGSTLTLSGSGTPFVNNGTFKADGGTVQYTSASATNIATGTYANLTISGAATKTLLANTIATSTLTLTTSGDVLDGAGFTLTLSGSGTPLTKTSGNGTFQNIPTITYSSASATNIATGTYANLELTGAATKTLLGATTATSTVTVPSGATLAISTFTFTATAGATWTNSGTVTEGTGGKIVHASASAFTDSSGTAKSFFSENNGDSVYLTVTDTSLNFDASTAESVTGTATISASSDTSSTETITLTETGIKTGIFRGGARLASISSNFPGILECFGSVTLSALFTDSQETDTSTPSSATGLCANGGGGGGSSAVAATTVTTATTATTTATTTAATTTPVVTATPTATAVSTLETVQTKVASVIAKIAALPTNPTTSDLASIQAEIAAILIELQSIQAAQPMPQGVALGFNFVRPLALGLRHADVSNLQQALKTDSSVYPEGLVTGYFGSMTLKAVQKFQGKYGIASPGVPGYGNVGPATRAKLNALYGSK